jgi:hypothetical protein
MGKLPTFAVEQQQACSWPPCRDLPGTVNLPPDSRVKAFRYEFLCDYRTDKVHEEPTTMTFIYVSGAGRGLQVLTT